MGLFMRMIMVVVVMVSFGFFSISATIAFHHARLLVAFHISERFLYALAQKLINFIFKAKILGKRKADLRILVCRCATCFLMRSINVPENR